MSFTITPARCLSAVSVFIIPVGRLGLFWLHLMAAVVGCVIVTVLLSIVKVVGSIV